MDFRRVIIVLIISKVVLGGEREMYYGTLIPAMDNIYEDIGNIGSKEDVSMATCASLCASNRNCQSYFYNNITQHCLIHPDLILHTPTKSGVGWKFFFINEVTQESDNLVEIANGKLANQSSTFGTNVAALGVDGDLQTYQETANEESPFWMVDLGATFDVRRIDVYNRVYYGYRLRSLDILIGRSSDFFLFAYYNGPALDGEHLIFDGKRTLSARYVMLKMRKEGTLHVSEVNVFAIL